MFSASKRPKENRRSSLCHCRLSRCNLERNGYRRKEVICIIPRLRSLPSARAGIVVKQSIHGVIEAAICVHKIYNSSNFSTNIDVALDMRGAVFDFPTGEARKL